MKGADANVVHVKGTGKAEITKRITHFSCEMKVSYSPVCLRSFSELSVAADTGRSHIAAAGSDRVGGTLAWIFLDGC